MTTHTYDLSALPISSSPTPPADLTLSFNPAQIVESGFKASSSTANVGAVWSRSNVYSGDIVKIEATIGNSTKYTGASGTHLSGVAVLNPDGSAFIFGTVNGATSNVIGSRLVAFGGGSSSLSAITSRVPAQPLLYDTSEFSTDAKITMYHDRVKGRIYCFVNGLIYASYKFDTVKDKNASFRYGVMSGATASGDSNAIKTLTVTDEVSSIPLHIGFDAGAAAQQSDTFLSGYNNNGYVFAGRYMEVPLENVFTRNGQVFFKVPSIINLADCTLPIDPSNSNIFYRNHYKFWNQQEMGYVKHVAPYPRFIQSSGINTGTNATATWNTGFSTFYNTLVGRHVQNGSTVFYNTTIGMSINLATGALSSSTNTGATIYIWDIVDQRIRQFSVTFSGGNIATVTRVQTKLLTIWECNVNEWVESEELILSGSFIGSGSNSIFSTTAEISVWNGTSWSAWGRFTAAGQRSVSSGNKVKLRMKTAKVSDTSRTVSFTVTNGVGFTNTMTWTTRTRVELENYNPNFTDTGENQLIGLINFDNGLSLTDQEIDISSPVAYEGFESGNTQATVTSLPNSGINGSLVITYQRTNIERFKDANNRIPVNVLANATYEQIIDRINTEYGLNLKAEDYTAPSYTPITSGTTTTTLSINASSLTFIGATTNIFVTVVASL